MNNVTLIGRLTRDPELRYIPVSGRAVANFTLAVDKALSREKRQEMEAKNQPTADFIRITVWGNMAESCANHLVKGLQVAVQGRIQTGSYKDEDDRWVNTFEVVANQVKFLEWADDVQRGGASQERPMDYGGDQSSNIDNEFGGIEGFHPTDNDDIPF